MKCMKCNDNGKIMNGERKISVAYIFSVQLVHSQSHIGAVNFVMSAPVDIIIGSKC